MTDTLTPPTTEPDAEKAGLKPGDYARSVTFCDPMNRSDDGTDWPVHVTGGDRKMFQLDVLIDGELIPGVKDFDIEYGPYRETLVTLHVNPDLCDVAPPFRTSIGKPRSPAGGIDGHALLTPYAEGDTNWHYDPETNTVACVFFVARVVFE